MDKAECLAALKKCRGSRFKAFRTYEEALKFAEAGAVVAASQGGTGEEGAVMPQPILNVEKPSPFRGPKSQDLVKFRKSIEKCDLNYFSQVSLAFLVCVCVMGVCVFIWACVRAGLRACLHAYSVHTTRDQKCCTPHHELDR